MSELCLFCHIAQGEMASAIVYEDDLSLAFLDHRPVFYGHTLLIPKAHYATLPDLPAALLGPLWANAQLLCRAVELGLGAEGSLVLINNKVSQSVAHVHIHIIPRRRGDGLRGFLWPRLSYRDEAHLVEVRDALRQAVAALKG